MSSERFNQKSAGSDHDISTKNKRAVIYYFTGTGNTERTSQKVASYLADYGIDTDLWKIQKDASGAYGAVPDPNDYDLVGFAYPIHAFNTPQFFLRFVKALPDMRPEKKGTPAFLFKTSGEPFRPNRSSGFALCSMLKRKGLQPGTDRHILMPYNIMFRYPDAMAKQMVLHMDKMARLLAYDVAHGRFHQIKFNPLRVLFSYVLRLQWFGANINGQFYKVKDDLCIGCGLCVKHCPSANIELVDGKAKVHNHCTMCMSCVMRCPKAAINPGFLTPWKVNGMWNFEKLLSDDTIPADYTGSQDAKYFKLFRNYYAQTQAEYEKVFGKPES